MTLEMHPYLCVSNELAGTMESCQLQYNYHGTKYEDHEARKF
jgi:hypothetical protein